MAVTLSVNEPLDVVNLVTANICTELTWSGRHPRSVTLNWRGNAGGYDFNGTEGGPLSEGTRIDVDSDSPYVVVIRSGQARNLHRTSLFIESDVADTDVGIAVEW